MREGLELADAVQNALSSQGTLAASDAKFVAREGQQQMALAVARALEHQESLVVEAGTGIGKTFAYLVPVLLSGRRVLVSTATKGLQDQLFLRDLPRLHKSLNLPVRSALLKGRASYLCLHRLDQARSADSFADRWAMRVLARIETWSHATTTGDLSEVEGLDEQSSVVPLVTSTRDNCLGSECPQFGQCHVFNARRQAMAADVVVINHHLFFADVALRDSGVAELLPSVEAVVFDEAHQLSDTGLQFLGMTLGSGQIADLAKDILRVGLSKARGWRDWSQLAQDLEDRGRRLRWAGHPGAGGTSVNLKRRWQEGMSNPDFLPAIEAVSSAAHSVCQALEDVAASDPELAQLELRSQHMKSLAQHFVAVAADDRIRWIDVTAQSLRLVESPLDVREIMSSQRKAGGKSWIFTSATLGEDDRLDWFCASTGLEDAVKLKIASPFDFASHARLWIVNDLPKPSDPNHATMVGEVAVRCAQRLRGRTFVLTTTLRAIAKIAQVIEGISTAGGPTLEVLTQGSQPKRVLLSQFGDGAGKVLVGSHSFWEGIDVPGDALQCVVIDKLPFPPPSDPLIEARSQRIEQGGGDAFNQLFVPEATIALKQGAGRLIRSETDRGLLVICDSRMARMGYGRRMRAALPAMALVSDEQEAHAWLDTLMG